MFPSNCQNDYPSLPSSALPEESYPDLLQKHEVFIHSAVKEYAKELNLKFYGYAIILEIFKIKQIGNIINNQYKLSTLHEDIIKEIEKDDIQIRIDDLNPINAFPLTTYFSKKACIWTKEKVIKCTTYPIPEKATITFNGAIFNLLTTSTYSFNQNSPVYFYSLLYKLEDTKALENFLVKIDRLEILSSKVEARIHGLGSLINKDMDWNDLILDPKILKKTKDDIEGWIKSEDRYKKLHMPYRRGYLFEGPPGNGKTAVSKVIAAKYGFETFTFNFSNRKYDDSDFYDLFEKASEIAPSLVLLEDIDRIFLPENKCSMTNITLTSFLNCLDGAADYHGVVVIATANNPENLDPAIRRRPGRFDVPVRFDNPCYMLRKKYLQTMLTKCNIDNISEKAIERSATLSDGMSMAFMKSIFEKTVGQEEINDAALLESTEEILSYYKDTEKASDRKAGF